MEGGLCSQGWVGKMKQTSGMCVFRKKKKLVNINEVGINDYIFIFVGELYVYL